MFNMYSVKLIHTQYNTSRKKIHAESSWDLFNQVIYLFRLKQCQTIDSVSFVNISMNLLHIHNIKCLKEANFHYKNQMKKHKS